MAISMQPPVHAWLLPSLTPCCYYRFHHVTPTGRWTSKDILFIDVFIPIFDVPFNRQYIRPKIEMLCDFRQNKNQIKIKQRISCAFLVTFGIPNCRFHKIQFVELMKFLLSAVSALRGPLLPSDASSTSILCSWFSLSKNSALMSCNLRSCPISYSLIIPSFQYLVKWEISLELCQLELM